MPKTPTRKTPSRALDVARVTRIIALVRKYGPLVFQILKAFRAATPSELKAARAGVKAQAALARAQGHRG